MALNNKNSLLRLVLPDKLEIIGQAAFDGCINLTGSLNIPEGVTGIEASAFCYCFSLTGSLSLPSTLEYIGGGGSVLGLGAFRECGFVGEIKIPNNVTYIGVQAFWGCKGLYGELHLPDKLSYLGTGAFGACQNLTGSLSIPQSLTVIGESAFDGCGFNGTLTLHDGITSIGRAAFAGNSLKGELDLPKNLTIISDRAFDGCDFSGELKLPKSVSVIGDKAFAYNWRLMGILDIPEGVQSIGAGAFAKCRSIEGLILPESLENIRYEASWYEDGGAFQDCFGIGSIVCKSIIPPYIQSGAFDGVAKDNFTLEVPESAIQQYQAASGWCDFKRIAAHHELVCRPSVACALNTEHKQTLVINAEGEWEVESKPDWCELSQTSGSKKTELTLTIKQMAKGAGNRNGEIKFRLKDKDYTYACAVTQYDYEYGEDQWLTLQRATRGNNGGINIVFVGDGYNGKDIAEGNYLKDMQEGMEHFFGIEPYKTYRNYFNVYTPFALSTESGVGTVNTIRYNRFNTTFTGGVGLRCDYDEMFRYALNAPTVTVDNLCQTLIVVIPNSTDYGGICQMWEDGSAIAFCPKSTYGYPLDSRGVMQHEAGGHGFGKLGDEYIYHNAFIDFCDCTCCGHVDAVNWAKSLGWYDNLSLTGKMHQVPWSHLIFDSRYSDIVDIFEGGYMHNRGVFRSEQNSCMNNDIPYYSTISRESIVKRIKRYAGEEYSFEEFVANDKRDAGAVTRTVGASAARNVHSHQLPPTIHKGSPLKSLKARKARR
ncbi:MAG: leucine-rich repeat protein [Prevotella sp.]|nr:leucine-rich repeat protein [Prevotella sp.]MBO5155530.1 leucine-rich repeat protein [Prevotella sp.]